MLAFQQGAGTLAAKRMTTRYKRSVLFLIQTHGTHQHISSFVALDFQFGVFDLQLLHLALELATSLQLLFEQLVLLLELKESLCKAANSIQ